MSAKSRSYNPLRLFNSVPFGVTTMALIAVYMATGSGRQWLRSTGVDQWPVLRDWFDKTDLEFFNAWPLKTLMALLVVNLIVVTWRKIPLTPPRYGVWCIHAGIVTLVLGSAVYYGHKLEGRVRIYADPAAGPNTVEGYYDKDERALYVRTGKDVPAAFPLPTLPRFQGYDETVGNVDSLRRRGLWGIRPTLTAADKDGRPVHESLAELVGAKGDFSADVVGFYPYANVRTDFDRTDPASTVTGVELSMGDPNDPATMSDWYVVASDPRYKLDTDHLMEVQHVEGDADVATKLREAAGQFFHLDVTTPGAAVPVGVYVKPGQSIPIGATGYTLKVETYNPAWPMFGTGVPVQALTMLVTSPAQQFRRMVLAGKALQTDFKLNDPKAGPMGGRQKVPLDAGLQVGLTVEDPYRLMPTEKAIKHTLVTPTGSAELVDVSVNDVGASTVKTFPTGSGDIELSAPTPEEMGAPPGAAGGGDPAEAAHPSIAVRLQRHDHVDPVDTVVPVPPRQREEQADEDGLYQAVKLRVRLGTWEKEIVVPYTPFAADRVRQDPWRGGYVMLPGAIAPLQFQLSNTRRPLPTRLTLDDFKVVPFAGGTDSPDSGSFMQDFRSTLTMSGTDDADTLTAVASLNHPIYFNGGRWLFFQAAYDPNVPHTWTQLGIGNRPAIGVMEAGCGMIFAGLIYAFYAKPIIIRRMKQRALAAAANRPTRARGFAVDAPGELVET